MNDDFVDALTDVKAGLCPALRKLKAVIFDVGGTLIHPDWPRLGEIVQVETGILFRPAQLHEAFYTMLQVIDAELKVGVNSKKGCGAHWALVDTFRALGIDETKSTNILERLTRAHQERHLWCKPDSEASTVLQALKYAGLRIAVISNTEDGRVKESLALADLDSHFEFVIDSHVVGCSKPDPAIFKLALDELGLDACEAAYVGDSYGYDVIGARRAGMYPILLDRAGLHEQELGLVRVRSLSELISPGRVNH